MTKYVRTVCLHAIFIKYSKEKCSNTRPPNWSIREKKRIVYSYHLTRIDESKAAYQFYQYQQEHLPLTSNEWTQERSRNMTSLEITVSLCDRYIKMWRDDANPLDNWISNGNTDIHCNSDNAAKTLKSMLQTISCSIYKTRLTLWDKKYLIDPQVVFNTNIKSFLFHFTGRFYGVKNWVYKRSCYWVRFKQRVWISMYISLIFLVYAFNPSG